jgi:hypothetical protein
MIPLLQRMVWSDRDRRARLLLRFAEVEADGGQDLVRAAEGASDPILRHLFLNHATDEQHHAALFRTRALELLRGRAATSPGAAPTWLAPGERGLDDVRFVAGGEGGFLAFLHLSEKAAAQDFSRYASVLQADPETREVFFQVLRDESFHMRYTRQQLRRVEPRRHLAILWRARATRLWKLYLRLAGALGALFGAVMLSAQYFLILPPFAWLARRAARGEPEGWRPAPPVRAGAMERQY